MALGFRCARLWLLVILLAVLHTNTATADQSQHERSCVLLRNGNVLEGKVSRLGDRISIEREESSTIKISSREVLHVGRDLDAVYQFKIANRFPSDLKQLQSDVRWSLRHGLTVRAAEDVMRARQLAPSDPATHQLVRQVAAALAPPKPTPIQSESNPGKPHAHVQTVSYEQSQPHLRLPGGGRTPGSVREQLAEQFDHQVDPTLVNHFATRVQPILVNRCVSCHADAPTNQTQFRLRAAIESTWAPKRVANENLESVLPFIDRDNPAASVLRTRAMDGHGGIKKSLGEANSPMMIRLDTWIQAFNQSSPVSSPRPVSQPPQLSAIESVTPQPPSSWNANRHPEIDPEAPSGGDARNSAIRRMPKVSNPFDPSLFNRRFHR